MIMQRCSVLTMALIFSLSASAVALAGTDRDFDNSISIPKDSAVLNAGNAGEYKREGFTPKRARDRDRDANYNRNRDDNRNATRHDSREYDDRDNNRDSNCHAGDGYDARDLNPGDARNDPVSTMADKPRRTA